MTQNDDKLRELVQLDKTFQNIQDLDILLEKILSSARTFVGADAGTIYLRKSDRLIFRCTQNQTMQRALPPGEKLVYSTFEVEISESSISGWVAKNKTVLNLPDVYRIPKSKPYSFNSSYDELTKYRTKSMLTIPLLTEKKELLGVLQMINAHDPEGNVIPFNDEDELFAEHFANAACTALYRAKLTRQMILRMISMAELRDPKETGNHVNRVAAYSVELYERWANKHQINPDEIEKNRDILRMAAMLHDVGKVAISDTILKKPARFTDEEYEIMKSHTTQGARLFLTKESEFDEVAQIVARTHHERWDGKGYPGYIDLQTGEPRKGPDGEPGRGLKGDEIPLWGRIVAVADVYDALSSKRIYKEAWDEKDVVKEMKAMAGTQFDPELVELFLGNLKQIRNITSKYPNPEE